MVGVFYGILLERRLMVILMMISISLMVSEIVIGLLRSTVEESMLIMGIVIKVRLVEMVLRLCSIMISVQNVVLVVNMFWQVTMFVSCVVQLMLGIFLMSSLIVVIGINVLMSCQGIVCNGVIVYLCFLMCIVVVVLVIVVSSSSVCLIVMFGLVQLNCQGWKRMMILMMLVMSFIYFLLVMCLLRNIVVMGIVYRFVVYMMIDD